MKCPICNKKIQDYRTDFMGSILLEEQASCSDTHHNYYYEYVTGNSRETINDKTFYESYTDSVEDSKRKQEQLEAFLKIEKEKYQNKIS